MEQRPVEQLRPVLDTLVRREVPVRSLTPGPAGGVSRLRFADSTTLLVTRAGPRVVGAQVVRAIFDGHRVTLAHHGPDPDHPDDGVLLTLAGVPGRHPAQLRLVGPDQPD